MKAFHGKSAVKRKYIRRIRRHRELDQLSPASGYGGYKDLFGRGVWKGCAVGCTLSPPVRGRLEPYTWKESKLPVGVKLWQRYQKELGIPANLAAIHDQIFEALPYQESQLDLVRRTYSFSAMDFPERFLQAIRVGANLSKVAEKLIKELLDAGYDIPENDLKKRPTQYLLGSLNQTRAALIADRLIKLLESA